MRRRDFIALLGGVVSCWPSLIRAQQPTHTVGFLNGQSSDGWTEQIAAIRKGLGEYGFVDGKNLTTEFRFANNQLDRLPALAAELVARRVHLIVTSGGEEATQAALAASATIPVVATFGGDPIEIGLVKSLNRPGGNLTGVSLFNVTLVSKQLELLHEAFPSITSLGLLRNPANLNTTRYIASAEAAAKSRRLQLVNLSAANLGELDRAFATAADRRVGALIVVGDPFFTARRNDVVALAARHRIPTMYYQRMLVEAGGLIGYGSNRLDDYHKLGLQAGRVLSGANAGDLPVLQPTRFELVINLKTAKTLGLELPARTLALADEVIE